MISRRNFLTASAGLGLLAGVTHHPTRLLAVETRQTVRGQVTGGGRPLSDVLVSDGRRVTRSDSGGYFSLAVDPQSGPFVFVSTPSGYWTEAFHVPVGVAAKSGRANFALEPMEQPDRFDFAFIADIHLGGRGFGIPKFKASIRELNGLSPPIRLLWSQGDICLQGGVGPQYIECLSLAKMPVRNGAGNHEIMLAHQNPRDDFHRLFGPAYYSFDFGPVHCILLDGNKPLAGEKGWKAVHGAVEGSELAWLEADLAAQPAGRPIIVGVHIPIVSTYAERRDHSPKNAPYWEMTNDRRLTDLFSRYGVRLVLQGHMHENERITVGGVEYVESISISGSWWHGQEGFERGVDNVPRGYRIVSVDGTRITHRYRSSCESHVDRQGEFTGLSAGIRPGESSEFVFNCYDAPNGSTAKARLDDGPWLEMPPFAAVNRELGLQMPHHFRLVSDTTGLAGGNHSIEAEVAWPDGTVVSERETFFVLAPAAR